MNTEIKHNNFVLRISATAACNLNCKYCNPNRKVDPENILSDKDLLEIIQAGIASGLTRVTWTGGEPTIRKDFVQLVRKAKELGIHEQSLSTNGISYFKIADELKESGLNRVNISLDTLDRNQYMEITGFDWLNLVRKSIEKCVELYDHAKINCIISKNNFNAIDDLVTFAETFQGKFTVRFLEIVPCGGLYELDSTIFDKQFVTFFEVLDQLRKYGELFPVENTGNVPKSRYFRIPGMNGIYGVNPNHSVGYRCDREACKKIRVSPNGFVSNCTIKLQYVRDFRNKTLDERIKLMDSVVEEKLNRDYTGFQHKQKYYDFWRFGILPDFIREWGKEGR